ncbi:MAG: SOUL family heme-binding protein [Micropepsaceae bacterium]
MSRLFPAVAAFVAAASVIGATLTPARADTEEPRHTVVDKIGVIEIRQYGPRLAADVIVQGDEEDARSDGFRALADYIFGNNTARAKIAMTAPVAQERSEKIAMTAPVAQTREGAAWRVRFFMPSKYTREALPQPNNPAIQIVEVPGETMAVLRFSNSRSTQAVGKQTAALLRGIEGSRWAVAGAPVTWLYDPPWTLPFFRRNEVAVTVRNR